MPTAPASAPRLLARSVSSYFRRPLLWLLLAAAPVLPAYVALAFLSAELQTSLAEIDLSDSHAATRLLPLTGLLIGAAFLTPFGYVLGTGALARGLSEQLQGSPVQPTSVYLAVLRRIRPLFGSMLLALGIVLVLLCLSAGMLLMELGLLAEELSGGPLASVAGFLPPWVRHSLNVAAVTVAVLYVLHAMVKWSVFVQVAIFEGGTAAGVLWRSRNLVRGLWWHAFWVLVGVMLLQFVLAGLLGLVGFGLASILLSGTQLEIATVATGAISQVFFVPLAAFATTWLYWDVRARKEAD